MFQIRITNFQGDSIWVSHAWKARGKMRLAISVTRPKKFKTREAAQKVIDAYVPSVEGTKLTIHSA